MPRPQLYIVPINSESVGLPLVTVDGFLAKAKASDELTFCRVSFNDPLLICYSSGTTGAPKCIVGFALEFRRCSHADHCCSRSIAMVS